MSQICTGPVPFSKGRIYILSISISISISLYVYLYKVRRVVLWSVVKTLVGWLPLQQEASVLYLKQSKLGDVH